VRVDRSPAGEELNTGEAVAARPAASLILLRDGANGPEVLLVQRNPRQRFMGGAWVFPGGGTKRDETEPEATARRELEEEAGIRLPAGTELVPFSRWITPAEVKVRFDTWFFVGEAPAGAEARPDGGECVDARWLRPADALDEHERGELMLVFPTIKQLERLAKSGSVGETLEAARRSTVEPIQPKVVVRDGAAEITLPGEPGYTDA
jgi:8-oxo-dGTP pyrophosphatase MutT (NUDIX family)